MIHVEPHKKKRNNHHFKNKKALTKADLLTHPFITTLKSNQITRPQRRSDRTSPPSSSTSFPSCNFFLANHLILYVFFLASNISNTLEDSTTKETRGTENQVFEYQIFFAVFAKCTQQVCSTSWFRIIVCFVFTSFLPDVVLRFAPAVFFSVWRSLYVSLYRDLSNYLEEKGSSMCYISSNYLLRELLLNLMTHLLLTGTYLRFMSCFMTFQL